MKKVYIGMPNYMGLLHHNVVISLVKMLTQEVKSGRTVAFEVVPRVRAPRVRNQIAQRFTSMKEFDYFCTIDDDHTFGMDILSRLMEHDVDVVGALAFIRSPERHTWLTPSMYKTIPNSPRYAPILEWERNSLVEVDAMGMAFTLIKREVLETLSAPWWWIPEEEGLGEDFYFCKKCKEAGYKLYCDTSVEAPHISGQIILHSSMYFDEVEEVETT